MAFLHVAKAGQGNLGDAWGDILWNLCLFAGWAEIHSIFARSFVKKALARAAGEDFVKIVYVTAAGITQTAMLWLCGVRFPAFFGRRGGLAARP
jgi:hypothetical protein